MTTLYEITEQYRADMARLSDIDIDDKTFEDTLEGMQGEIKDKLRAVIAYSLEVGILAEGASAAADRMKTRASFLASRASGMRAYALRSMMATGITAVASNEFEAKIAKTPGKLLILNDRALPAEFVTVTTSSSPNKVALRKAIERGVVIDGVSVQPGYRLAVR